VVPSNVENIGSACFSSWKSLASISFAWNFQLKRIESETFRKCSLQTLVISQSLTFIDGSAFAALEDLSISAETRNCAFSVEGCFLLDAAGDLHFQIMMLRLPQSNPSFGFRRQSHQLSALIIPCEVLTFRVGSSLFFDLAFLSDDHPWGYNHLSGIFHLKPWSLQLKL
jgi:hypothetical protein